MAKPAPAFRAVRRIVRATGRSIARTFAPFEVFDSYGTCQRCYTMRAALAWLPYCSPAAAIGNRYSGRVIITRMVAA